MSSLVTRRSTLLVGAAAAVVGAGMSGMAGCNVTNVIATIAELIQKVQQGVATACAAVGKVVPTVDTVLAVIEGLLGATLTQANLAAGLAVIQAAIDALVKIGCPTPAAGLAVPRATSTTINGKPVPVHFY